MLATGTDIHLAGTIPWSALGALTMHVLDVVGDPGTMCSGSCFVECPQNGAAWGDSDPRHRRCVEVCTPTDTHIDTERPRDRRFDRRNMRDDDSSPPVNRCDEVLARLRHPLLHRPQGLSGLRRKGRIAPPSRPHIGGDVDLGNTFVDPVVDLDPPVVDDDLEPQSCCDGSGGLLCAHERARDDQRIVIQGRQQVLCHALGLNLTNVVQRVVGTSLQTSCCVERRPTMTHDHELT